MALPSSTVNSQHLCVLQVINIVIIGIVCPSLYNGDAFHIYNKKNISYVHTNEQNYT